MQISTIYWSSDLFICALIFFFLAAILGFTGRYKLSKELEDFTDLGLKIFVGISALLLTISFIWFMIDNLWILVTLIISLFLIGVFIPIIRNQRITKQKQVQT